MNSALDSAGNATKSIESFQHPDAFVRRHVGPSPSEQQEMARVCGYDSVDALLEAVIPDAIRRRAPMDLPKPLSEFDALGALRSLAERNQIHRSLIGMGYYDTRTPAVIQRNILENPGWYTQYTPYQAEISQGRLEGLLNFQTLISDLTGLDIANASLLDESTACAEAMTLAHGLKEAEGRTLLLIASDVHPQSIEVVRTRAIPLGIEIRVVPVDQLADALDARAFGVLLQYPGTYGDVRDAAFWTELSAKIRAMGALTLVATDLLALTSLTPPGEWGADVAVGSAQRFGVPLGFGGPHAGFIATRDAYKRQLPGRLVGVSKDSRGRPALRLSLQTREQHIRREKATSNICTAQALLANVAMAYAVYHGPEGLTSIAQHVHQMTGLLAAGLEKLKIQRINPTFFDTLTVRVPRSADVLRHAESKGILLRRVDADHVGISFDERTNLNEVSQVLEIFNEKVYDSETIAGWTPLSGGGTARSTSFLQHPVFHQYRSETELQRYLRRLESRDLSLCHSMIPLGSCTMKLNAASEMLPISWPEFAGVHPFVPLSHVAGYLELFRNLEAWLAEITGFSGVSLQPNAGSQGEFAGLLVIRAWHAGRNESHRTVCLIPASAHGTNPASAVMAGFEVVAVACDSHGNADLIDLAAKVELHKERLGALMITYPSTHGVFETSIHEVCRLVHDAGGQVYMDGANLNAQVGLVSPGELGADVCHLNLHKTFCIPHGGGGPGVGPIAVAEHLVDFLPDHPVVPLGGEEPIGPISAARWGSAGILPISWMYIAMMGGEGLIEATRVAILNANYIADRLAPFFPVLYRGPGGRVAHECIIDIRPFKKVTAEDVAKRLMDFGFHAPTLSWPVAGTLMIEPTESEGRPELDRFCDAMIAIHAEILAIERGEADPKDNVLKNAPHTADMVSADEWTHPYSRRQAAYPFDTLVASKFWPAIGRVDNVHGDRHLVCSCAGMEAYAENSTKS